MVARESLKNLAKCIILAPVLKPQQGVRKEWKKNSLKVSLARTESGSSQKGPRPTAFSAATRKT